MRDKTWNPLGSMRQIWNSPQTRPIEVQEIERVVDDLMLRLSSAMLKRLEGRSALQVQSDDLAVHDRFGASLRH